MTLLPGRLNTLPFNMPGLNPVDPPIYVNSEALTANTAVTISIPQVTDENTTKNAQYLRLAANVDIYVTFNSGQTAAVPSGSSEAGASNELVKAGAPDRWYKVPSNVTSFSVVSGSNGIVTASFYTA